MNLIKYITILPILITVSILVFSAPAYAQLDEQSAKSSDILLSLSPAFPGPHEQVRVSAKTFSFDVNTVSLSWYVNEKLVKSGKGAIEINITTGAIGTPTVIKATAKPPTITNYEKTITIWPSTFDVLWHSNTYTPVGYKGKALPVHGSVVMLTASPSFVGENGSYKPETLLYEWRIDNILQKTQSGKGKNVFSLPITKSKNVPPQVSVRVYNENKTIIQEKHMTIPVRDPELLFYEIHPLRGPLYQQVIESNYQMASGKETRILAEPFYASGNPASLQYQWSIDRTNLISDTEHPEILSYYAEVGNSIQQRILLEITNPFNILEQITKSFHVRVE